MSTNNGWRSVSGTSYLDDDRASAYPERQFTQGQSGQRRSSNSYYPGDAGDYRAAPIYGDAYRPPVHGDQWRPERTPPPPGPDRYVPDQWRPAEPWTAYQDSGWPARRRSSDTMAQTMASRMFEPSESWKQHHIDRPPRSQFPESSRGYTDRRPDPYAREFYGSPSREPAGYDYPDPLPPPPPSDDRYRGHPGPRDPYGSPPRRYDSYRPGQDDSSTGAGGSRPAEPRAYPSMDSPVGGFRRDSRLSTYNRRPSPQYGDYVERRSPVRERSVSGPSRAPPPSPSGILRKPRLRTSDGGMRPPPVMESHAHTPPPRRASRGSMDSTASSGRKRMRSRSSSISSEARRASRGKVDQEDLSLMARPMARDDTRPRPLDLPAKPITALSGTQGSPSKKRDTGSTVNLTNPVVRRPSPPIASAPKVSGLSSAPSPLTQMKDMAGPFSQDCYRQNGIPSEPRIAPHSPPKLDGKVPTPSQGQQVFTAPGVLEEPRISQNDVGTVLDRRTVPEANGDVGSPMAVESPSPSSQPVGAGNAVNTSDNLGATSGSPLAVERVPLQGVDRQSSGAVSLESYLKGSETIAGPSGPEAKTLKGALCRAIQARREHDRQTREDRVEPVLHSNFLIAPRKAPPYKCSPQGVINEIAEGPLRRARLARHQELRKGFISIFADRHAKILQHQQELRETYLRLHEEWKAKCADLDRDKAKPPAPGEGPSTSGRTTRRSAATMGDAVRSDLEMEQIIASLGNEDLTDATSLAARNAAKIPDMISVVKGRADYVFDDTNNRVLDPPKFYSSRTGFYDWTEEETQTFFEQFAAHPKQFGIIAEFLPHKTTAQCIAYYYLHKKSQFDWRKVITMFGPKRGRRGGKRATDKQKGNALLTDIRRHDAEVSGDVNGSGTRGRRGAAQSGRTVASRLGLDDTPTPNSTPDPETTSGRPRRNRTTRYPVNPDADDDGTDSESKDRRRGRRTRKPRVLKDGSEEALETKFIDQTESTARRKTATSHANWTENDKILFLRLLSQYGDDFKRIAASMPHKTTIQVTNFYKNNLNSLRLDQVAAGAPKRSPTPHSASDNWQDVHRPYPPSNDMSPSRYDSALPERPDGPSEEPEPEASQQPRQPTPPPPPASGQQQVIDFRNGVIIDQRSTWFSAGSNGAGPQPPAGPLDPAGHFTGTVDLGLRMYQGIQPQIQYRPMGGPLPSLGAVLPGQGLQYGFTPEYNTYGRLPYHRSMPLGAADPRHPPLPTRQDERPYSGHPQNSPTYNTFTPDQYAGQPGQPHWPAS